MGAKTNPEAFGRLYDHYIQPVYRYLYSRVGTVHEAEDLASQTFMAAFKSMPRYRERGQFAAWLFRIARSKLMDHYRGDRHEVPLEAAQGLAVGLDTLASIVQTETLGRLRFLLSQLKDDEQELIRLRYVADLSFAEIANLLGKREDAVKKSVYRLLARLKGQME
jgi:RNA polymerase sigma-70 factor (ECF subfamily)